MIARIVVCLAAFFATWSLRAAEPIDGRSAARWHCQPTWSSKRLANTFSAGAEGDWLRMTVQGQGKEMIWSISLSPAEIAGEPRYLVLRYRATGLSSESGGDLLLAQDGSRNWRPLLDRKQMVVDGSRDWRPLLDRKQMVVDGREHVLAIDLPTYQSPAPIQMLALAVGAVAEQRGRLLLKLEFCDAAPEGIVPLACPWPPQTKARIELQQLHWTAVPKSIANPAERYKLVITPGAVLLALDGPARSMRWTSKLSRPLDLSRTPFVAVRYRVKGRLDSSDYLVALDTTNKDRHPRYIYAMRPGDVIGDGQWHVFAAALESTDPVSNVALGLGALGPSAVIELDYLEFSSQPIRVPVRQMLSFEHRQGPWPDRRDGFTTVALPPATRRSFWMGSRMGLSSWFNAPEISVRGIPFRAVTDPLAAPCTVGEEDLAIDLPEGSREILLLMTACFPTTENSGWNLDRDSALGRLDEPERAAIELRYKDGTAEEMLPVGVTTGAYGFVRGIALYAVRPSGRQGPVKMIVHDRMRNASFGLVGVTVNRGSPRIPEPELSQVWYPELKKAPSASTSVTFSTNGGLTWDRIASAALGARGPMPLGQPVFRLRVNDQEITSAQFRVLKVEHPLAAKPEKTLRTSDREAKPHPESEMPKAPVQGIRITASYQNEGLALNALFECRPDGLQGARLTLDLSNAGPSAVTGTLFFPTLTRLSLGDPSETWCFCGRRGGLVSREACAMRDPIGESHPLQVDGFFNPSLGAGICLMPRDLEGIFRWYRVGKDAEGGNYALEFLPQTVRRGESWQCVPTVVAVVPGDWRDQFHAYLSWVKTWYRPIVPRKAWFQNVFSFQVTDPGRHGPSIIPIDRQLDLVARATLRNAQIPGSTDYLHLFGWAQTKQFGHWGAYDHYESVGGKDRFRQAVQTCQQAGVPVGLYLDGYLVANNSDKPGKADVEKWAIQGAGIKVTEKAYQARSMCPYVKDWRDYLAAAFRRVAEEIKPSGMYVDEFGACLTSHTCYSNGHGHPSPMGMSPGEWLLSRQIRAALPAEIATYCEFVQADVAHQYLDGDFRPRLLVQLP